MSGFSLILILAAQAHTECWLQYKGWLNGGTNPSVADVKAELQSLAAAQDMPWEILCALYYQESGIRQFASDGKLLHNVAECKKNYQKYVLGWAVSAPTPPGLGMTQLTGGTASGVEPSPYTQIRTDWKANLAGGVQVLAGKWNAYIASSATPSFLVEPLSLNRDVIENWYIPLWRYNGYVGNYGSFPKKIWSHLKNRPGVLTQYLPESIPATHPDVVIAHFFDGSLGEAFVAKADGQWVCKHGSTFIGTVHLTSGAAPPPPPPGPTPVDLHLSVATATLNVRGGPGTSYPILGTVLAGQRYFATAQQGAWYRIWFDGYDGWVNSGYVGAGSGNSTQVSAATLEVRNAPGGAVVGSVAAGQKYGVSGTTAPWLRIYWAGGEAWIDSTGTTTPISAWPKLRRVTTGSLNVRSGPGTSYGIIGTAGLDQRYVAIGQSGEWYKIYFNGQTGWIHGAYTVAETGTCVKVATSPLNVRTGPGTTYSTVGQVSQGQLYFLAASSGSWRRIHWGGSTSRWVHGSYVTNVSVQ